MTSRGVRRVPPSAVASYHPAVRRLALLPILGTITVFACEEPTVEEKCEFVYDRLFDDCDQAGSYECSIDGCVRSYSQDDCHAEFDAFFTCIDTSDECCEEQQIAWVFCFNEP